MCYYGLEYASVTENGVNSNMRLAEKHFSNILISGSKDLLTLISYTLSILKKKPDKDEDFFVWIKKEK